MENLKCTLLNERKQSRLGRSPGERKGYPLQYSGLENSMDRIVHGVTKSQTQLRDFHLHFEGGIRKHLQLPLSFAVNLKQLQKRVLFSF